ncbi:cAMP-dependent protein kinase catalytic subunit isoform X1 [Anastrepha ludens]|uniref:cAMP-dependent protein kinase catalytic subunit isoform X1 n=1 Tax=Anastrepha ludens TaxID=28586 RepID=UPI0023B0796A|nr:cAMP-dependent protein kinase catalytic subunit isoform X1 [Anastrepha ludens]
MLSEEEAAMDYDELTLNPLLAEIEAESSELDPKKEKQRRYWTAKEETRFFEIWGRDNWRLTRHGKNTIFFAQWAVELKERFNIEVKPEEIQAKVNQTRAKFRQVKKQISSDKNAVRWKKFAIIDKILKNQYRPKDADPVPKEALENNRDIDLSEVASPPSPHRAARQFSPTSITSSSNTQEASTNASATENNNSAVTLDVTPSTEDIDIKVESEFLVDPSITTTLFNTTSELFSDPIDEVKSEFPNEYHNFGNYPQPNHFGTQPPTQDDDDEEPQLHTLQTPQQLLEEQLQQQQQQQYQQYRTPTSSSAPPPDTTTTTNSQQHPEQIMQQNVQQTGYDHSGNTYAPNPGATNQNHFAATSTPTSTRVDGAASSSSSSTMQHNSQYAANNNHNNVGNDNTGSSGAPMQPPTTGLGRGAPGQPRRRRTSHANNMVVASQSGAESLETMYLNEVRKKNILLAEQLEIARKRMQLEERKLNLLDRFFPKCLEMQEKILGKLNGKP